MKLSQACALFVCAALPAAVFGALDPPPRPGPLPRFRTVGNPVSGEYIVQLRPEALPRASNAIGAAASILTERYGGTVFRQYEHALTGFAARLSEGAARRLSEDPWVDWVEENALGTLPLTQANAPWGLDRIDQRILPRDGNFNYIENGTGVHVYFVDTGIRATHADFGGRVTGGVSFIADFHGTDDCYADNGAHGHGTGVASIVGGATNGVAKNANLHPVRVYGCTGGVTADLAVAGINWVIANDVFPAVAVLELQFHPGSTAVDTATQNLIADGVSVVTAAGNYGLDGVDACDVSPARVGGAITVGASDASDVVAGFSDQGSCVDAFAPGVDIQMAGNANDNEVVTASGTSFSTPHVAGVAAQYLAANPQAAPFDVANNLIANTTANVLTNLTAGSPNRLLYSGYITCGPNQVLSGGLCINPCAGRICNGVCVDVSRDRLNCGGCGFRCGRYEGCVNGDCVCVGGGCL